MAKLVQVADADGRWVWVNPELIAAVRPVVNGEPGCTAIVTEGYVLFVQDEINGLISRLNANG